MYSEENGKIIEDRQNVVSTKFFNNLSRLHLFGQLSYAPPRSLTGRLRTVRSPSQELAQPKLLLSCLIFVLPFPSSAYLLCLSVLARPLCFLLSFLSSAPNLLIQLPVCMYLYEFDGLNDVFCLFGPLHFHYPRYNAVFRPGISLTGLSGCVFISFVTSFPLCDRCLTCSCSISGMPVSLPLWPAYVACLYPCQ
jgi:hypothetical protein